VSSQLAPHGRHHSRLAGPPTSPRLGCNLESKHTHWHPTSSQAISLQSAAPADLAIWGLNFAELAVEAAAGPQIPYALML